MVLDRQGMKVHLTIMAPFTPPTSPREGLALARLSSIDYALCRDQRCMKIFHTHLPDLRPSAHVDAFWKSSKSSSLRGSQSRNCFDEETGPIIVPMGNMKNPSPAH